MGVLTEKVAILCYHKNANEIYPAHWIDKYRDSIREQTYQCPIFEVNYGGDNRRIFEESYFESHQYPTFVHALNYLLDKVFSGGYFAAANSNVDDWFRHDWIERELADMTRGDYDLVSCNFCLVKNDRVTKYHRFHNLNIQQELERGHNPVAHPAVLYHNRFWMLNRYDPDERPYEDMNLWIRALKSGSRIFINEQNLLFHRVHENSVSQRGNE